MALTQEDLGAIQVLLVPIGARLDKIDERLDRIDERLDTIDERLDTIDERLDNMDERFDEIDARLDSLSVRVENIEGGNQAIKADIATLNHEYRPKVDLLMENTMGTMERYKRQDLMEAKLEDHDNRIFALEVSHKK